MAPSIRDGTEFIKIRRANGGSVRGQARRFLDSEVALRFLRRVCIQPDAFQSLRRWVTETGLLGREMPRQKDKYLATVAVLLVNAKIEVVTGNQSSRSSFVGSAESRTSAAASQFHQKLRDAKDEPRRVGPAITPSMLLRGNASEQIELKTWIEIELVGEDDEPIPFARYEVRAAGETRYKGRLNAFGLARHDPIDDDNFSVVFPDLDQDAWARI